MSAIKENLEKVNSALTDSVLLVAVTKTRKPEEINEAIECEVTDIGENKVQEIIEKYDKVSPVRWHMIGHLQTNKVKNIIDKVDMIHSVDSLKLAGEIEKRAEQAGKTMDILVQVNPGGEESKFGVSPYEAQGLVENIIKNCKNIKIRGLMCVARLTDDEEEIREDFRTVKKLYDKLKEMSEPGLDFRYLSMGMSGDYKIAIEEGSNLVRIGSSIFGQRVY